MPGRLPADPLETEQIKRELQELTYHWTETNGGAAYKFRYEDGEYVATRTDSGHEIRQPEAIKLRIAVADDYADNPVPRNQVNPR